MKIWGTFALLIVPAVAGHGQPTPTRLSLSEARRLAVAISPEQRALAASVAADRARARQLGAAANPALQVRREDTDADRGGTNQIIVELSQPLDWARVARQRGLAGAARAEAAGHLAQARMATLDLEVIASYHRAVAAEAKLAVIGRTVAAFDRAVAISSERLASGDVSGLTHRRLTLEAARFAAFRARLALDALRERAQLASMTGTGPGFVLTDSLPWPADTTVAAPGAADDARRLRPELAALEAELRATDHEATAERRNRLPAPVFTAGFKSEAVGGQRRGGLVSGLQFPLAVLDRREAALDAIGSDRAAATARLERQRLLIERDIETSRGALWTLTIEHHALAARLGPDRDAAVAALQVGFAEGELTVTEWLDTIRAFHDAEATMIAVRAEAAIERARLDWATGQLGRQP